MTTYFFHILAGRPASNFTEPHIIPLMITFEVQPSKIQDTGWFQLSLLSRVASVKSHGLFFMKRKCLDLLDLLYPRPLRAIRLSYRTIFAVTFLYTCWWRDVLNDIIINGFMSPKLTISSRFFTKVKKIMWRDN